MMEVCLAANDVKHFQIDYNQLVTKKVREELATTIARLDPKQRTEKINRHAWRMYV